MYFWNKDLHHWRKSKTLFCNWIVFESQNLESNDLSNTREHACHVHATPTPIEKPLSPFCEPAWKQQEGIGEKNGMKIVFF